MSELTLNDGQGLLHAAPALRSDEGNGDVLSADSVKQWREQGFALVSGVLPDDLIEQVCPDMPNYMRHPHGAAAGAGSGAARVSGRRRPHERRLRLRRQHVLPLCGR